MTFFLWKTVTEDQKCARIIIQCICSLLCVCVCVSEREIVRMGEHTRVCESMHMHVCVCVCKHVCMKVCITLQSVNFLITTKKFQHCNGCNVCVYNVRFVCFLGGGGGHNLFFVSYINYPLSNEPYL